MAILAVFRNFFRYYQNAEKVPFLQNFFVQYFVAYATGFSALVYIIYRNSMSVTQRQNANKMTAHKKRPLNPHVNVCFLILTWGSMFISPRP